MTATELLSHPTIEKVVNQFHQAEKEKQTAAYNLFSLSTYTSHLENFHSDVIASLLDARGLHGEGNKFLDLFIRFLNQHYHSSLCEEDFQEADVLREKGRIDIWIRNLRTNKGILIENKINNAGDRDQQLDDYYNYSEKRGNCAVSAIIYLSLDGLKTAPIGSEQVNQLVISIGAFANSHDDLVNGWLMPCFHTCTNPDSSTLIYQYIKLLRHLASRQLFVTTMDDFYTFVNQHDALETLHVLLELKEKIPIYRTDKFVRAIEDHRPFTHAFRYKPNYQLYDFYREGVNSFKLDVHFMTGGHASLLFWNPPQNNEIGNAALVEKLKSVEMLHEFELYGNFRYAKYFRLKEECRTMAEADEAIIAFTKEFLKRLKGSQYL